MATKLLLIEDVADLGRSGDIVNVKEGYARNFLLPKRFAIHADANALRKQAALQEERKKRAVEDKKQAEELAAHLSDVVIKATVKVDHEGHLYGSVSVADILKLMQEQHEIELDKWSVLLKQPIKMLGSHRIDLKLKENVPASIVLKVVSEDGREEMRAVEEAKGEDVSVIGEIPEEGEEAATTEE